MIILDSPSKNISISLVLPVTTNQLPWVTSYVDLNNTSFKPIGADGLTNDDTPVSIIVAPATGVQRQVKYISVFNADTVTAYITIALVDATASQTLVSISVPVGNTLVYHTERGWQLFPTGTFSIPLTVTQGGTGATSFSAYTLIAGGINNTAPLQSLAGTGNSYQILTSNGAGQLPSWQNPPSSGGGGTVINFSAGNANPLFTTSVATSITTPSLTFNLDGVNSWQILGNNSGTNNSPPVYFSPYLTSNLFAYQGGINTVLHGNGAGNLSWGQIIAGDISNNAVTYVKMQQASAATLLGNPTGGLSNVQEITLGSGLSFSGNTLTATGSISGSGAQYQITLWTGTTSIGGLTNGASGTILQSNGTGANPSWVSALANGTTATTQSSTDNSTKIATDAFVQTVVANAIAGVNPAIAVSAATVSSADTSAWTYNNGASGIGATFTGPVNTAITIDGFTFTAITTQSLLVKNDTQSPAGAFNGIFMLIALQTALTGAVFTRRLDYDTPNDINNTGAIPVINGTVNGDTSWLLTSNVVTVGTSPLTYTQFTLNPSTIFNIAGTGLTGTGSNTVALASALPNGQTATTQVASDNSTKVATTAMVQSAITSNTGDYWIPIYKSLGSVILAETFPSTQITLASGFGSQSVFVESVYLQTGQTITGAKWFQAVQGIYTANNYNGIGLYTYVGGTLTLVASSVNDGTIWKVASNTYGSKAFSSQYIATAGIYYIAFLYCSSAASTNPTLGAMTAVLNASVYNMDFTNSASLVAAISGQTSFPSPQSMSGLTFASTTIKWFGLY